MPGSGRDVDSQAVDMDSRAARETARQRRRAELRKQERHARPPSKQQVEYDRELDSWIASHGAPDTELDHRAGGWRVTVAEGGFGPARVRPTEQIATMVWAVQGGVVTQACRWCAPGSCRRPG